MTPAEIYAELRKIAPSIAFAASHSPDIDEVWDGDGPDPADEGMIAVVVDVSATAIVGGEEVEGHGYLSSHYIEYGEDLGDVSGYLPQMLEEAVEELAEQLPDDSPVKAESAAVVVFLKEEMRRRYDEQRAEIEANR